MELDKTELIAGGMVGIVLEFEETDTTVIVKVEGLEIGASLGDNVVATVTVLVTTDGARTIVSYLDKLELTVHT